MTLVVFASATIAILASLLLLAPLKAAISIGLALGSASVMWIDARQFRIPDALSLPAIPVGILTSAFSTAAPSRWDTMAWHILGAIVGSVLLLSIRWLYRLRRGRDGLGLGDVKLSGAGGAWLGAEDVLAMLLLACALALAVALGLRLVKGPGSVTATTALPFGTAMAPAIWLTWFWSALD